MRIAVLNWRDLTHPRAGGSEVYAQELARHWATDDHQVTFHCAAVEGQPAVEERDGYTIHRGGSRLTVYRDARRRVLAMRPAPDVLLDVVNTRPFLTPRWAGPIPTVALIYQLAADVWPYEVPLPAALVGRHVLEPHWLRAYRRTPVLTISDSTRRDLVGLGLGDVRIVPVGVGERRPPTAERSARPSAVFVGRLAANKRPDHAIEAAGIVGEVIDGFRLHVIGDGPMRADLESSLPPRVVLHGRVTDEEKWRLVSSSHALVATSVREGWGMTVSEAALAGTRAIAYDVPGLRDSVAAAGGVLVEPRPAALAEALVAHLPTWVEEGPADLGDAGVRPWSEVASDVLDHLRAAADASR